VSGSAGYSFGVQGLVSYIEPTIGYNLGFRVWFLILNLQSVTILGSRVWFLVLNLRQLQGISGNGIAESTRRFRQTIFKLNHEAKKKQQRRKGNAGGRRAVLDHVSRLHYTLNPNTLALAR